MIIRLEQGFRLAKAVRENTDDHIVLSDVYIGLTKAIADIGTAEDLKELVKQYEFLSNMIEEGVFHESTIRAI